MKDMINLKRFQNKSFTHINGLEIKNKSKKQINPKRFIDRDNIKHNFENKIKYIKFNQK